MTKRDFELIAYVIAGVNLTNEADRRMIAVEFADALASTNPRFDRERFIEAALR